MNLYILSITLFCSSPLFSVITEKSTAIKIHAYKKLTYPQQEIEKFGKNKDTFDIKVFGGKSTIKENCYSNFLYNEYINLKEKCPIAQTSFAKLIKQAQKQKRSCIIASTRTKSSEGNKTIYNISYFDASYLHTWMFDESFTRKEESSYSKHILFNEEILSPIYYFAIDSLESEPRYLGNETIFKQNSPENDLLRFFIAAGIKNGESLYESSVFYGRQGKFNIGEKYLLQAADNHNHALSKYSLGILYKAQNKLDLSLYYFKRCADEDNDDESMYELGNIYQEQNKLDLALKYFINASKNNHADAIYGLAKLYTQQKKMVLAEKYLKQAADDHDHEHAIYNLARLYTLQKKLDLAIEYYQKSIDIHNDPDSLYELGLLHYQHNTLDLAKSYLTDAADNYDNAEAMYSLGKLYEENNEIKLAIKYYKRAVDNHNHENSMISLGNLYCEKKYFGDKKLNLAIKYYGLAANNHNNADAMEAIASIYEDNYEINTALKYYARATKQHSLNGNPIKYAEGFFNIICFYPITIPLVYLRCCGFCKND